MDLLQLIVFILPAYFANGVPVLFKGRTPIDFGNKLGVHRLFGENKTYKGFVAGVAAGTAVGAALAVFAPAEYLPQAAMNAKILAGFALALGTMTGDLAGSFLKRRLGYLPGSSSVLLDQLPFLFFALIFTLLPYPQLLALVTLQDFTFLVVLTIVLHWFFNTVAHRLQLKKVPW